MSKKDVRMFSALFILTLLCGCISGDIKTTIKRNGLSDWEITFSSSIPRVLDGVKEGVGSVNPKFAKNFQMIEEENKVVYIFKDIKPGGGEPLFLPKDASEKQKPSDVSEKFKLDQKMGLVYTDYTITFPVKGMKKEDMFKDDSSEMSELSKSLANSVKLTHTLQVFGTVYDTNGMIKNENTVSFNLLPEEDKEYYVKFKDLTIYSLLGTDSIWIWVVFFGVVSLGILIIAVLVGGAIVFIKKRRKIRTRG